MVSSPATMIRYRVRLGHMEVAVLARDEVEALVLARRALAQELPRFYDLIRALKPERFELKEAA
jgi:hypothetical protein